MSAAAAAHVVTCEGVRRGRAAGGGSVFGTRVEVGPSESLCCLSACCFSAAVPASELVLGSRSRRCPLLVASADWLLVISLDRCPPPLPRGAFRWASSLPLPPAPHRSSRDEFFHLFRDEPDYDASLSQKKFMSIAFKDLITSFSSLIVLEPPLELKTHLPLLQLPIFIPKLSASFHHSFAFGLFAFPVIHFFQCSSQIYKEK